MRAGSLYYRIDILQRVETPDAVGGASVTWPVLLTLRAGREDIGGREIFRGSGLAAEFDRRYTIREPNVDLDATMRLRDPAGEDGELFEISRIGELPAPAEGLEILATAVDRTGRVAA